MSYTSLRTWLGIGVVGDALLVFLMSGFYSFLLFFLLCFYFMFKGHACVISCRLAALVSTSFNFIRCGNFSWGTLWSRSPLWVWVAVFFPSPDRAHSFSMGGIHWVCCWWWWNCSPIEVDILIYWSWCFNLL